MSCFGDVIVFVVVLCAADDHHDLCDGVGTDLVCDIVLMSRNVVECKCNMLCVWLSVDVCTEVL